MANDETVAEVAEPPKPIAMVADTFPVYMVSSDAEFEAIQAMGHICCFLISNGTVTQDKVTRTVPSYFKMMNTSFGSCVAQISGADIGLDAKINTGVAINYPKIPWQMQERMDMFFRQAHKDYGTEATVLLTYDMSKIKHKKASDGWDFYVPTQENTAVGCRYELSEVQEHLEGTPMVLAGSAHSHPDMQAYFSHTDHKDQADFDGIHITYGWKKGGETEHHAEVIMGGIQWPYHPFALMEETPKPNFAYTALDSDLKKVSEKKTQTFSYQSGVYQHQFGGQPQNNTGPAKSHGTITTGSHSAPAFKGPIMHLPVGAPDVRTTTIVSQLLDKDSECPFCAAPLTDKAKEHLRCYACSSFFCLPDMEWDKINEAREKVQLVAVDLISAEKAPRDIFLWVRDYKGNLLTHNFERVCLVEDGTPKK